MIESLRRLFRGTTEEVEKKPVEVTLPGKQELLDAIVKATIEDHPFVPMRLEGLVPPIAHRRTEIAFPYPEYFTMETELKTFGYLTTTYIEKVNREITSLRSSSFLHIAPAGERYIHVYHPKNLGLGTKTVIEMDFKSARRTVLYRLVAEDYFPTKLQYPRLMDPSDLLIDRISAHGEVIGLSLPFFGFEPASPGSLSFALVR